MAMTTKEKQAIKIAVILGGVAVLWWLWQRQQAVAAAPGDDGTDGVDNSSGASPDPITATYSANPAAFNPPAIDANINIANQGLSGLSNQYIPLFGFVGMASGVYYQ
jgi:hypothetical protein